MVKKVAMKTRSWLEKALLKVKLEKFNLGLQFDFKKSKILEKILGQFYFYDSDIKFHSAYGLIKQARGVVKLEQKKLDILVNRAFIDNQPISNIKVFIPYMLKNKSILNVTGDIKIKSQSLIKFLLAQRFSQDKLRLLNKVFINNNVILNLALAIKLKPKIQGNDIKLQIYGKIDNLSKQIFSNDSYVNFKVNKSFAQSAYVTLLDYTNTDIDFPFIKYVKSKGEGLKINFKVIKNKAKLSFADITIANDHNVDIKGLLSLDSGKLSSLNINNAWLGKNNFSLHFIKAQKTLFINAPDIFLQGNKFFNIVNIKGGELKNHDFIIEGNINNLHFSKNKKLQNIQLLYNCITKCDFLYLEGDIAVSPKKNLSNSFFLQYANKNIKEIIFETDNLGYILSILGINDKVFKGDFHLNMKQDANKLLGRLYVANFYIKNKKLINKLVDLKVIGNKSSLVKDRLFFYKGVADISLINESLRLKEFVVYGKLFGMTSKGDIDLRKKQVNLSGSIVPAYKINNLLGVKDIPLLGKIVTGGKDKGLISASYKLSGNVDNINASFNPITIILPSFLKSIGGLF